MELQNKVAIVTGGVGGIGLTTVQYLLRNGVEFVAIFDVHEPDSPAVIEKLQKLEDEFQKDKFGYYSVDVTNTDKFRVTYEKVTNEKKYVDILVNNAGTTYERKVDLMIDLNFKAVVHGTLMAIEYMGKQENHKGGIVINIASILGLKNADSHPIYCATKHAVVSFVRALKTQTETLGVRVVAICPGITDTPMAVPSHLEEGMLPFISKNRLKDNIKERKCQEPDNVASAIIEIIKTGKFGDIWLVQNDEPAVNIDDPDAPETRIPL